MDKTSGPTGRSIKEVKNTPGVSPKANSGAADKGSDSLYWVNDKGELCWGTSCFSMRVKPGSGEVRVVVDRNECGADTKQLVDTIFGEVIKGAKTVYETESQVNRT